MIDSGEPFNPHVAELQRGINSLFAHGMQNDSHGFEKMPASQFVALSGRKPLVTDGGEGEEIDPIIGDQVHLGNWNSRLLADATTSANLNVSRLTEEASLIRNKGVVASPWGEVDSYFEQSFVASSTFEFVGRLAKAEDRTQHIAAINYQLDVGANTVRPLNAALVSMHFIEHGVDPATVEAISKVAKVLHVEEAVELLFLGGNGDSFGDADSGFFSLSTHRTMAHNNVTGIKEEQMLRKVQYLTYNNEFNDTLIQGVSTLVAGITADLVLNPIRPDETED